MERVGEIVQCAQWIQIGECMHTRTLESGRVVSQTEGEQPTAILRCPGAGSTTDLSMVVSSVSRSGMSACASLVGIECTSGTCVYFSTMCSYRRDNS
jgi:hypothetical protein